MATVIFDFDSTILRCESLEELIKEKLAGDPEKMEMLHSITNKGMSGECDFLTSLSQRLELASPTLEDINNFTSDYTRWLTPGMEDLIQDLKERSIDIWIISGALQELLLPFAREHGIAPKYVHGVKLQWNLNGHFASINKKDPFSHSKAQGAKKYISQWRSPVISIGDGITDYALYENGLVDYFIAFSYNVAREPVIAKSQYHAKTVQELKKLLEEILSNNVIST